ncbi:hypothetical protein ILUMI_21313 [Ignelater luminosus]|uniref:Carboxylesterase type B domain-containing protein n=1 Tax=Ignelater luminosus TaxID=2038154 RepID=A0A8K0G3P3_IGNLU|nr:hypothetical protein ILUMI_21313 [Ignelater luminosus]
MNRLNFFCLLALCMCFAREPPKPPLIVDIPNQGMIMGKEISMIRTQRIMAYLAIPYAEPPLEYLRFSPPQYDPPPSWKGIRNATEFAPSCLQGTEEFSEQDKPFLSLITDGPFEDDEDCLYINVFVPYGGYGPSEGFATMVWFHPGNFTTGNPAIWNPYTLVYRQRVIVVTFAYRLNVMGFFTTNDGEAPGNYGLMDQQAALVWVKNNIKLFGGDPNNICAMGYGSGAVSIGLHMVNRNSQNLFSKAIIMSGNFLHSSAVKQPHDDTGLLKEFVSNFGCNPKPTSDLIRCLRRVRPRDLITLSSHIDWKPIVDSRVNNNTPFLSDTPKALFERGDYFKVPILTGYTDMEEVLSIDGLDVPDEAISEEFISNAIEEIIKREYQINSNNSDLCSYNDDLITDSVLFFYRPTIPVSDPNEARKVVADFSTDKNFGSSTFLHASFISKDETTYMYRFDTKPSTVGVTSKIPEWISVPHLFDLIYVWGIPYWAPLPDQEWDSRDKKTSDIIMSFWATFAKSTNPTDNSIYPIRWDPFTKQNPLLLIIDRNFSMSDATTFNYKSLEFWNDYFPKVAGTAGQCCNTTDLASSLRGVANRAFLIYLYFLCILFSFFLR